MPRPSKPEVRFCILCNTYHLRAEFARTTWGDLSAACSTALQSDTLTDSLARLLELLGHDQDTVRRLYDRAAANARKVTGSGKCPACHGYYDAAEFADGRAKCVHCHAIDEKRRRWAADMVLQLRRRAGDAVKLWDASHWDQIRGRLDTEASTRFPYVAHTDAAAKIRAARARYARTFRAKQRAQREAAQRAIVAPAEVQEGGAA